MMNTTRQTAAMLRRLNLRSKALYALLVIFLLLLGGWAWYFFSYSRTPAYALEQIQTAIKTNDAARFRRYVNVALLTDKAYDDLTQDLFASDKTLTAANKSKYEDFYKLIKPTMQAGLQECLEGYTATGTWPDPAGNSLLKGQQLGIDFNEFVERSQVRNTSLVQIVEIRQNGRTAAASIEILEEYTQTSFLLIVQLEADDSGSFQVAYIQNYGEFLAAIRQRQSKDVADYIAATQKIVTDYNNFFQQQQTQFKNLTARKDPQLSPAQSQKIKQFIEQEIIPAIEGRDNRLQSIEVPAGAQHLHDLRLESDALSIKAWQSFADGLATSNEAALDTAASLYKRALELDKAAADIVKHTAVTSTPPSII